MGCAAASGNRLGQAVLEEAAVGQARQCVVMGKEPNLVFSAFALDGDPGNSGGHRYGWFQLWTGHAPSGNTLQRRQAQHLHATELAWTSRSGSHRAKPNRDNFPQRIGQDIADYGRGAAVNGSAAGAELWGQCARRQLPLCMLLRCSGPRHAGDAPRLIKQQHGAKYTIQL